LAGRKLTIGNHSNKVRVEQMNKILQENL